MLINNLLIYFIKEKNMKEIVLLDGWVINPGDLSWDELNGLGHCTIYDQTPPDLILKRAGNAEIILTNKVILNRELLKQLPHVRYIGVTATGYNNVDIKAASEQGIVVTNVPAYGTKSVAQLTIGLLLELTLHVGAHAEGVRQSRWASSRYFSYWDYPLIELDGLTLGIVGYGTIGKAVAAIARALGMHVLVTSRTGPKNDGEVEAVSLQALLKRSDVVSLHCPLTPETASMINVNTLSLMKPTAFLLNTSRGGLINEPDLAQALNNGKIAGAGLDVLVDEPPSFDNPLLKAKNCIVTPHIAWATQAARKRLIHEVCENIKSFLEGVGRNKVH